MIYDKAIPSSNLEQIDAQNFGIFCRSKGTVRIWIKGPHQETDATMYITRKFVADQLQLE